MTLEQLTEIYGLINLPEGDIEFKKIPLDFIEHPPRPEKLIRKTIAFNRESELPDILVDGNMVLLDGYCSYLIAKQVGAQFVKIMQVKGER